MDHAGEERLRHGDVGLFSAERERALLALELGPLPLVPNPVEGSSQWRSASPASVYIERQWAGWSSGNGMDARQGKLKVHKKNGCAHENRDNEKKNDI